MSHPSVEHFIELRRYRSIADTMYASFPYYGEHVIITNDIHAEEDNLLRCGPKIDAPARGIWRVVLAVNVSGWALRTVSGCHVVWRNLDEPPDLGEVVDGLAAERQLYVGVDLELPDGRAVVVSSMGTRLKD